MPINREDRLRIDREGTVSARIVPASVRWLAFFAGCSSAAFGLVAFGAPFLILGALIQPRARTSARWLMWVGALLLSQIIVPYGFVIAHSALGPIRENTFFLLDSLLRISAILVCLCDIALVIEALKSKGDKWAPGSLDWVVWITAIVLTSWCVWADVPSVRAYQLEGSLDILLTTILVSVVIAFFDIALISHAVKTRRKRRE